MLFVNACVSNIRYIFHNENHNTNELIKMIIILEITEFKIYI